MWRDLQKAYYANPRPALWWRITSAILITLWRIAVALVTIAGLIVGWRLLN